MKCRNCNLELKIEALGLCNKCYNIQYYQKNKIYIKEENKKWRENNKEKDKITNRTWYENNKERCQKINKLWRENNRERDKENNRQWYKNNKEKVRESNKKWRENNKEWTSNYNKKWRLKHLEQERKRGRQNAKNYYKKNKDKIFERYKRWLEKNREKDIEYQRRYYKNNKEKIRSKYNHIKYNQTRLKREHTDIIFKIRMRTSDRIRDAVKSQGTIKSKKTIELLGCTIPFFREHIEKQFKPEMSWKNYGKEWHLDHIIPCSYFILTEEEQQKLCFHYSNYQPLWKEENLRKNNKIED